MPINSDTFLEIKQYFDEAVGDYLSFDTTTNLAASTLIVSTTLNSYDDGEDDYFIGWWAEITEGNNIGVVRKVYDYATSTGTLTCRGANFSAESGAMTIRLHRYDPTIKDQAIKRAIDEVYPNLHIPLDNQTLITGNVLPDGHFESWSSTSALTHWAKASGGTLLQTSTAGLVRGGKYSAKYTANADNDYIYCTSDTYPRLLDFQGKTVNAYCWVYPEVANDASIVIYTKQADGTAQALESSTTCPAGEWTLIILLNQSINLDLVDFQIRLKVGTNTKYVYFDDCLLASRDMVEYYLPDDFYEGQVDRVMIQNWTNYDPPCYDMKPFINEFTGQSVFFTIKNDGTYKYLQLQDIPFTGYRMRLLGSKPLETPTAFTSTITIDTHRIPLLIAKARMIFWERVVVPVSKDERAKFEYEYQKAARDYSILLGTKSMQGYSVKRKGS